ncbi:hypothetical protein [Actinophytocola sp.]|uniref:hypothetical protein n=1 Tax=Actinophytocola sp. TaxID=1872138 RepID=UPI002ED2E8E0
MVDSLVRRLSRAIERFETGEMDIADLQDRLETVRQALDHTVPEVLRELEHVVAELETIRFTRLEDEQRPAALRQLVAVKAAVNSVLETSDAED